MSEYLSLQCDARETLHLTFQSKQEKRYLFWASMCKYKLWKVRSLKSFYYVVKIFVGYKFRLVLIFAGFTFRHLAKKSSLSTIEIFTNKVYTGTLCRWNKIPITDSLLKFHNVGIRRFYLLQNIKASSSLVTSI